MLTNFGKLRGKRKKTSPFRPSTNYLDVNNNQLTALPESIGNLSALQDLCVTNSQLTALPESIGNLQRLDFLGVRINQLITLPAAIGNLRSGAGIYATDNSITSFPENIGSWNAVHLSISGANLPASVWEALRNLYSGPGIDYNMVEAGQAQTIAEDREQARNLELAVEPWIPQDHPGKDVLLQEFRTIQEECESTGNTNPMREFSRLLDRLPKMADYKIDKATVEENVGKMLHVVRNNEAGRNKLFETAQTALGTCGDRVAEGWSNMLTALDSHLAIHDDWALQKRIDCIRGEWLHQHIEWKTHEMCQSIRFTDPVEIAIGFKMQLADEFKLPNVMKSMLFAHCAETTDEQKQEMRAYLHKLDHNQFIDYLAEHPLWKDTMQQRHQDTFQLIDDAFTKLIEEAIDIEDFASPSSAPTSPVLKMLFEKTVNQHEWIKQTLNEISDAKDYARRLICVQEAQAALSLTRTLREKAAHEPGSSSSAAMLEFKPKSRLEMTSEAAEQWEARRSCLEKFSLETVDAARRAELRSAAGKGQLPEETVFTLDDYENFKKSTSLTDYIEQIKAVTGASNPRYQWAKLDETYNGVAPVGRLTNTDHTFIFVLDSATPDSPHVNVILAPAAAFHEREAAALDGIIDENSVRQPKERKKVSVNCQEQKRKIQAPDDEIMTDYDGDGHSSDHGAGTSKSVGPSGTKVHYAETGTPQFIESANTIGTPKISKNPISALKNLIGNIALQVTPTPFPPEDAPNVDIALRARDIDPNTCKRVEAGYNKSYNGSPLVHNTGTNALYLLQTPPSGPTVVYVPGTRHNQQSTEVAARVKAAQDRHAAGNPDNISLHTQSQRKDKVNQKTRKGGH